jgi:antirestriction protein ArdC
MTVRETQREVWTEQRADQLQQLQADLAAKVSELADTADWRGWLQIATKFHHYSFGNIMLIGMQRPDATQVAGYKRWEDLGRNVKRGERGITILAPITIRGTSTAAHNESSKRTHRRGQEPERSEAVSSFIVGVKPATVFDVSQTEGEPLPKADMIGMKLLEGEAPAGLWESLVVFADIHGFRVLDVADAAQIGGANGVTEFAANWGTASEFDNTIRVRADMDDAARTKTLIHEVAHMLLHRPVEDLGMALSSQMHRGRKEVEADSVAYLVAAAHGMDTASYSFGYVANWLRVEARATDQEPTEIVQDTAKTVLQATQSILAVTQPADDTTLIRGFSQSIEEQQVRLDEQVRAARVPGDRVAQPLAAAATTLDNLPTSLSRPAQPALVSSVATRSSGMVL